MQKKSNHHKKHFNEQQFHKGQKKPKKEYEFLEPVEDGTYITDADGQRVARIVFEPNGKIHLYNTNDNFTTHSHDVFSSMETYIHRTLRAYQGFRNSKGDLYHRPANQNSEAHTWKERD